MKLQNKKREILIIITILIIQTIVFIGAGINKSYLHMDEAYSLGLANYNKIDIQENQDFYNTWHNKEYYEDYLKVNKSEQSNFMPVYENQKNDVHPPLYYLLLRMAMGFHVGSYSKWSGIILNIIIYLFITIFIYLIIKKIFGESEKNNIKFAILALISSLTLASINNVIYIRMYALSTLNILATTYFHLKLLDKKNSYKLLLLIGLSALAGSLTHYYYLLYLVVLVIMFSIKYLKEKEYKQLAKYIVTLVLAGILSLVIFPYSINHIFFGYRGQGVIKGLTSSILKSVISILAYIFIVNVYTFNNALFIILIFILGLILYKKHKKITANEKNKYIKYIALPTLFYALFVSIASPFIELRYIMPISSLIFVLILYYVINLTKTIFKEKLNKIAICICILIFIMPFISNVIINVALGKNFRKEQETAYSSKSEIALKLKSETNLPIEFVSNLIHKNEEDVLLYIKDFKLEPEVLYTNKRNITSLIKENANLPAVYIFDSNHNRFLDDILLFTYINESYIAKDIEVNEENIRQITLNKNTSNGVIVFINDGNENDEILNTIKNTLKLENIKYLEHLNACDVYLLK